MSQRKLLEQDAFYLFRHVGVADTVQQVEIKSPVLLMSSQFRLLAVGSLTRRYLLAELAGGGRALEFGIATGRVALPLARRGVRVAGIELSQAMVDELRRQGGTEVELTVGDFATARAEGSFSLVYLLRNTITNLTTQDEQVAAFANAGAQLEPGGCFVVENYVPHVQRIPPGETSYLFVGTNDHVGVEEYDLVTQVAVSRHWWLIDGQVKTLSSPHRYLWPSELDLMAKMARMALRDRWTDWHRAPFTAESRSHVSVWEKQG